MDILNFDSGDVTPWPVHACATRNHDSRKLSPKIDSEDWTERQRDGHIISTGPHLGPSDTSVGVIYEYICIYSSAVHLVYYHIRTSIFICGKTCAQLWVRQMMTKK